MLNYDVQILKVADLQMLKKIENEQNIINGKTGQVMFSEESYYYWPLIQVRKLTKSLVKHRFSLHILLR